MSTDTPEVIEAFVFLEDGGDGSAVARYYPSAEAAETAADAEDQRFGEDTYRQTFTVENGVLKPTTGFDGEE